MPSDRQGQRRISFRSLIFSLSPFEGTGEHPCLSQELGRRRDCGATCARLAPRVQRKSIGQSSGYPRGVIVSVEHWIEFGDVRQCQLPRVEDLVDQIFLLPLVIVLAGKLLYRETLSFVQKAAAAVAAFGVAHELYRVGTLSWETMLVALGLTAYFVWRRWLGTNNLGGFWFDMLLVQPAALAIILTAPDTAAHVAVAPHILYLLPGIAVLSAAAFISYMLSSWHLPLSLFGLLGYVEPVFLFVVALVIGEALRMTDLLTYVPIMLAIGLLALSLRGGDVS
ncbi:MAG: RarD protein superfamily transporter [Microvirga sp.]|nr:RarD protein superfamily transporter [Microvirga sp.]